MLNKILTLEERERSREVLRERMQLIRLKYAVMKKGKDFPEVINSIVVVKIPNPTDISLASLAPNKTNSRLMTTLKYVKAQWSSDIVSCFHPTDPGSIPGLGMLRKSISPVGIALSVFSLNSDNKRVKRHHVLLIKVHVSLHIQRIICLSKHSGIDCEKKIFQSSWHQCSLNMFLLVCMDST
ncbi:hypothetical protein TNCV_3645591 [Trichonephila clavipes]|nr:hypothetical protein TNCV_3645591 [Trichonephila clavipes]